MADRFPLILNTSNNQIQEIASGDNLDLTGTGISNAGIITAGNVTIGAATTDLIVTGDARITGILTIGTSSLKLDGPNNLVNVGTALTLGHTQGLQFHTQNLHSAGFEVNQVNASGIITATGADINGDIDVDGHTNLDNVSVSGVSTFAGNADFSAGIDVTGAITATGTITSNDITIQDQQPRLNFVDNTGSPNNDYLIQVDGGNFVIHDSTNTSDKILIAAAGYIDINSNTNFSAGIDVTGNATVSGNLSVGGVLTYEDVTNVDSVGIVTARNGLRVTGGTSTFTGAATFNGSVNSNAALNIGANSQITLATGNWAGDVYGKIQHHANRLYLGTGSNADPSFVIRYAGNDRIYMTSGGTFYPTTDSSSDLGKSSIRWANLYADTLYGDGSNLTGIDTDLVSDTSPQLGGDLDVNDFDIKNGNIIYELVNNARHNFKAGGNTIVDINGNGVDFKYGNNTHADNVESRHGTHNDIRIYHSGSHSYLKNTTDYTLWIQNNDSQSVIVSNNSGVNKSASFNIGAAAELYHANNKKFETSSSGVSITGQATATDFAYSSHPGVASLTGNNSTTTMTIASGHNVNSVLVVYNGVVLTPTTDYTISGTTLTLQFTPPTNSQVVVRYLIK